MQLAIHGRHLDVTPALRQHAEKKLARLDRYFAPDATLDLELSVEKNPRIAEPQVAEITVHTRGETIRVRTASNDMYAAIDLAVDRLRRQASDHHDKLVHDGRPRTAERSADGEGDEPEDEEALVAEE